MVHRMDELEIKAEKITTEMMQGLADLLGEVDCALFEEVRHQVIHLGVTMAIGVGFNFGRKILQQRTLRKVIQCSLTGQPIKLWNSISDATKALGVNGSAISKVANSKPGWKTAGGYIWRYSTV